MIFSIDLGSNSFRVLEYDCATHTILNQFETVVGTADGLTKTGKISNEALQRIINAITLAKEKFNFDPTQVQAVTTAAMRNATNSQEILNSIQSQTGVHFKIIQGDEEARLTLLAMQYALKREKIDSSRFILVDIGGGSTEIMISDQGTNTMKSFDLGIITLTQALNKEKAFEIFSNDVQKYIQSLKIDPNEFQLIATAGTPTTIAALKHGLNYSTYDSKIINGTQVNLEDLDFYKKLLLSLNQEEANALVGTGRHDYMEAGIDIFKKIYQILSKSHSIVFDDGLREGVAINYCLKNSL